MVGRFDHALSCTLLKLATQHGVGPCLYPAMVLTYLVLIGIVTPVAGYLGGILVFGDGAS
jgi:hypothetical protein